MKLQEKQEVTRLRKNGMSLRDIAKHVPVSRSTISRWCKNVQLTEEQTKRLEERSILVQNQLKGSKIRKDRAHAKRLEWQLVGAKLAENCSPKFAAACMLFWAEGTKDKNQVQICNSDVDMLKFWVKFLKDDCHVRQDQITMTVHCHLGNGIVLEQIEDYWREQLQLHNARSSRITVVKKYPSSKGYRKNKLPYGVCRITVYSTELSQKLFGAIRYIAKFQKYLCLD